MANPDYDNTNRGSLFINKGKYQKDDVDTEDWPEMQGKINVYGIEFYVSAWTRIAQSGENQGDKYQSLSIKPVDEEQGEKLKGLVKKIINGNIEQEAETTDVDDLDDMDDDLPF